MSPLPVAIVTGAGSGIGRATALLLARCGYAVALAARSADSLAQTAEQIGSEAPVLVQPTDVTEPAEVGRLVGQTLERFGRLDALVNNAGYASLVDLKDVTIEEYRRTLDVNLLGPVLLTAAAWASLAQRRGIVVNLSSLSSVDPFPGLRLYGAAKAAVNLLTKGIADEGLRAVAILPGAVETPMLRRAFDEQAVPKDKALAPEAVAQVIVDCITGRRSLDNGGQIVVSSPT